MLLSLALQPQGLYERARAARAPQPQSCGQTAPGWRRQRHRQRHRQGCAEYQPPYRVHLSISCGDCTEVGGWHEDQANSFWFPSCIETGALGSRLNAEILMVRPEKAAPEPDGERHCQRLGTARNELQKGSAGEVTAGVLLPRCIAALVTWWDMVTCRKQIKLSYLNIALWFIHC